MICPHLKAKEPFLAWGGEKEEEAGMVRNLPAEGTQELAGFR